MAINWLNKKLRASAHDYVAAILEACALCKVKDPAYAFMNTDAFPRLQKISEVEFAVGWLHGAADAIGIKPEELFAQVAIEIRAKLTTDRRKARAA